MIWVTKDGRSIKIKYMTTDHIKNAIKHLHNQYENGLVCGGSNIDGYMLWVDKICDVYSSVEEAFPVYIDLKKELEKRK